MCTQFRIRKERKNRGQNRLSDLLPCCEMKRETKALLTNFSLLELQNLHSVCLMCLCDVLEAFSAYSCFNQTTGWLKVTSCRL